MTHCQQLRPSSLAAVAIEPLFMPLRSRSGGLPARQRRCNSSAIPVQDGSQTART